MENRYMLLVMAFLVLSTQAMAQDRYLDMIFDDVEVESDVTYGRNFTVQLLTVTGTTVSQDLVMDIYRPAGDTVENRPLVIYLHTGNFLPIQINGGVTGAKTDSAAVEVCTRLARMGYVAVSADYRTGWNPFAESASERTLGLINAAYRGLQDARTCIRYFKRDVVEGENQYGIDTSKITLWGQGTGGYIALATATLDEYSEILTTTMPAGKFIADLNGDGAPDPMIVPDFNGDIYGTSMGIWPGGGAIPAGDTLCIPNHVGYNSDFQLCVNMGGALGDISWLEAGEVPMIGFQVPLDEFAPYNSRILDVPSPLGPLPVVEVQGSKLAIETASMLGNNDVFASVDDETTDAAIAASEKAGHDYFNGFYPFNQPVNMFGRVDGAPWDWWNAEMWDTIVHPTAGTGQVPPNASFHFIASLSDPDMSAENGRTYIDTVMSYFAPRAYLALGLTADTSTTAAPLLNKADVELLVSPNPSQGWLQVQSSLDYPIQQVRILDITGRTLIERPAIQASLVNIDHSDIGAGIYLVEVLFEEGRVVQQVVFD